MDINKFLQYLEKERKASENTLLAYRRDVEAFNKYMMSIGSGIENATETDVLTYIMNLNKKGSSRATTNRKISSLRVAFDYLIFEGKIDKNPTNGIKTSRTVRQQVESLTVEDVENILSLPDDSTKGKRDKAILEVLYGTGIRAIELIDLNFRDLNTKMGFIQCTGAHGRPRIVPLGRYARNAVNEYLRESRPVLLRSEEDKESEDRPLFLNYMGERMTRQGLWKVLGEYGKKAGLTTKLTPHILRTSFAVHMLQNGADIKTLQELMGYDDVQAMQAFLQIKSNRIKDVYDKTHPRA